MYFKLNFSYLFFLFAFTATLNADQRPIVLVTVAPHQYFVEQIAGDLLEIQLMVPPGASSHTYEPTMKEVLRASNAVAWFYLGEPFERQAIQALKSHNPQMLLIDMKEGVNLIQTGRCSCCPGSIDLHIWSSLREAKTQATTIASALQNVDPAHSCIYQTRLETFLQKLNQLDAEITALLKPIQGRTIVVSHPAYAYFCRDYGLNQLSIEIEGKDPAPRQLTALLASIRQLKPHSIFIQKQYANKAASLIAETVGSQLVLLDPYAYDYLQSLTEIAHAFRDP